KTEGPGLRSAPMSLARAVAAPAVLKIPDPPRVARRRLPAGVFDYGGGGAGAESTPRAHPAIFCQVLFRPRGAVVSPKANLEVTLLGTRFSVPFLLAPVGSTRMLYPKGEVEAARAAGAAGTGFILSTLAGTSLEEVKAGATGPCWYQ